MKKLIYIITMGLTVISCNSEKKESIAYSGEDMSEVALITRNKETKVAILQISKDIKWSLFTGNTVETIDLSAPIAEGNQAGEFSLAVNDSTRSYFFLKTKNGTAILAEKHLPMTGGYNFRDMGGLKNKEGQFIKWGRVFRSDDLHSLTDADLTYLGSIPLHSIIDFRSPIEIEKAPDKLPGSAKGYHLSINPGSLSANDMQFVLDMKAEEMVDFMKEMNRSFSTDSTIIEQYRTFFAMLQDETKLPLMFHCTAGKDRTGMAGALFLYSLGVDENVIIEDYLLSNLYLGDKFASYITQYPNLKLLFEVRAEFLQAGIDQIKENYGSVENYLSTVLNVNPDKMKELFLYK